MTAGEERHQHLVDDRVLPDDDLPDLAEDSIAAVRDAFGDRRATFRLWGRMHQCVSE